MPFFKNQIEWLQKAKDLTPVLFSEIREPIDIVKMEKDANAFQGWRAVPIDSASSILGILQPQTTSFILDFGEHLVGQLQLKIGIDEYASDAPLRLKLIFAEVPSEIAESFDPFNGTLSRSWLQDEIITLDDIPTEWVSPRRYAFRYLKIQIEKSSPWSQIKFDKISCKTVTSADSKKTPALNSALKKEWGAVDTVSLRTLANCMHTVFEDGPKRDRRLWVGDLRLQAQANYLTFQNNDLVKRCLYLYAGLANEEGKINVDLYERPIVRKGNSYLMDYGALYAVILYDYFEATKDLTTATELFPVVVRQLDFILLYINQDGLCDSPANIRIFIDWCDPLHRQASMQAILIYTLRRTILLAKQIGLESSIQNLISILPKMEQAARQYFWDKNSNAWISGHDKQISWASWAWMVLAEVSKDEEARKSFKALYNSKNAVKPNGPYLYHHVVEALLVCGLPEEGKKILHDYWGGMIQKGATTFWEVFDPNDDKLAPYADYHINSYCHAWSCTPTYFIRKYF